MDAKAMAKSKRSHSQHHSKKFHPNQIAKAPPDGTSGAKNAKKPQGKQVSDQPRQSRGSSVLPTNWDRYKEEYDSGSEETSHVGTSQNSDVIKPKSKGADYRHLISEAQSQTGSHLSPYLDSFTSMDDILPDFNLGMSSVLSVRGEGIISWIGDDNFVVEDKETASYEAPFFSLNLHSLAEKLAKIDLSKRLFIEADLLPLEPCPEESKAGSKQESDQTPKTRQRKATSRISDDSEKDKITKPIAEAASSCSTGTDHRVLTSTDLGSKRSNQIKGDLGQFGGAGKIGAPEFTAEINTNPIVLPKKKLATFEVANAEAELDMLLDSLGEEKFLDSSGFDDKSSNTSSSLQDSNMAWQSQSRRGQDTSKAISVSSNIDDALDDLLGDDSNLRSGNGTVQTQNANAPSLDDSIDDLLQETSNLMYQYSEVQSQAMKAPFLDDSIDDLLGESSYIRNRQTASQPNDLEGLSLDESIDDLLNETSTLMERNKARIVKDNPLEPNSSSSGFVPKSKVLSDFDAWLDTI